MLSEILFYLVNLTEFSSFSRTRYFDFIDYCLYLR